MPSGAGHDAQMLARVCPTAMIFTQSRDGISHNPTEHTPPADLAAGADVLLHVILALSGGYRKGKQLAFIAGITVGITLLTYLVFRLFLKVPFPTGIIRF